MSIAPSPRPSTLAGILRVLVFVLIFALLGPPIGGVSLITMIAIVNMGPGTSPSDYVTVVMFALIYGVAFAYLFGVLPAALVGLVGGIRQTISAASPGWRRLGSGSLPGLPS